MDLSTKIYSKQGCQIKMVCQWLETIWFIIKFFFIIKKNIWPITGCIWNFPLVKEKNIFIPFRRAFEAKTWTQLSLFPLSRGFSLKLVKIYRWRYSSRAKETPQNVPLLNGQPWFRSPCLVISNLEIFSSVPTPAPNPPILTMPLKIPSVTLNAPHPPPSNISSLSVGLKFVECSSNQ